MLFCPNWHLVSLNGVSSITIIINNKHRVTIAGNIEKTQNIMIFNIIQCKQLLFKSKYTCPWSCSPLVSPLISAFWFSHCFTLAIFRLPASMLLLVAPDSWRRFNLSSLVSFWSFLSASVSDSIAFCKTCLFNLIKLCNALI
jgi:hypothetical protein